MKLDDLLNISAKDYVGKHFSVSSLYSVHKVEHSHTQEIKSAESFEKGYESAVNNFLNKIPRGFEVVVGFKKSVFQNKNPASVTFDFYAEALCPKSVKMEGQNIPKRLLIEYAADFDDESGFEPLDDFDYPI